MVLQKKPGLGNFEPVGDPPSERLGVGSGASSADKGLQGQDAALAAGSPMKQAIVALTRIVADMLYCG